MTDNNKGGDNGGFVKKLLFPAAASGANDTFRSNHNNSGAMKREYYNNNNDHNNDDDNHHGNFVISPPRTPISAASGPNSSHPGHRHNHNQHPNHAAHHEEDQASNTMTILPRTMRPANPPRFFSSTHPSADHNHNNDTKTVTTKQRNSRVVSHWQTKSPKKGSPQETQQTPVRIPPSPPPLNRKPATPNSEANYEKVSTKPEEVQDSNDTEDKIKHEKSSGKAETDSLSLDAGDTPCDEGTIENGNEMDHNNLEEICNHSLQEMDDNDSLQFLRRFKAKRDRKASPAAATDYDDAETEVHNNTTAYHQRQQVPRSEDKVDKSPLTEAEQTQMDTQIEQDVTPNQNEEISFPEKPFDRNISETKDNHNDHHSYGHGASPPTSTEYRSYYDNPYHNPLVASAMKPHDLFRNPASHDIMSGEDESDVNSNASEMGTVINAPNLFASRFAEVDAMEREQQSALHHDEYFIENDSILEEEDEEEEEEKEKEKEELEDDDPVLSNYKAFKAHDDDVENSDDDDGGGVDDDVKDVEGGGDEYAPKAEDSVLADLFRTPVSVDKQNAASGVDSKAPTGGEPTVLEKKIESETLCIVSQRPISSTFQTHAGDNDDYVDDDAALSEIDAEIDQLVRRSASESSGGGIVKSCSSNNSSDIFRAPSAGSEGASSRRPTSNHQRNTSLPLRLGEKRLPPNRPHPQNKSAEIEKGVTQSDMDQSRKAKKEDEKEEKEGELQGHCSPHGNLATTIRRIGSKITKRPSPSSAPTAATNPYFFDIDDDEENEQHESVAVYQPAQKKKNHTYGNSVSAPTTPRRMDGASHLGYLHSNHDYNLSRIQEAFQRSPERERKKSPQIDASRTPASFLLRSPGSSARLMADFKREMSSGTSGSSGGSPDNSSGNGNDSNRFAFLKQKVPSILQSASSASLGRGRTPRATGGGRKHLNRRQLQTDTRGELLSPSRGTKRWSYTRGCLSFDTTADNKYEYEYGRETQSYGNAGIRTFSSFDVRHHQYGSPRKVSMASKTDFKESGHGQASDNDQTQALYGSSRSWDIPAAGTESQKKTIHLNASAFRTAPYVRHGDQSHHPHALGFNNSDGRKILSGERQRRLRLMSETDTMKSHQNNLKYLQTPQRIEIEREDALNLLACLCERGVSLNNKEDEDNSSKLEPSGLQGELDHSEDVNQECGPYAAEREATAGDVEANTFSGERRGFTADLEPETIGATVDALRNISESWNSEGLKGNRSSCEPDHQMRMHVIDELMRSYTYAHEMKRAALSASAWLRSIGHSGKIACDGEDGEIYENGEAGEQQLHLGSALLLPANNKSQTTGEEQGDGKASSGQSGNEMVDLCVVNAMLHQAQMQAREKDAYAQRLNDELSKCRAEIGRVKSEARSKQKNFTSPNRSILHEEDDESTGAANDVGATGREDMANTGVNRNDTEEGRFAEESFVGLDSSLLANEEGPEIVRDSDQPIIRELAMFKSALSDANAIIKQLHAELKEAKPDDGVSSLGPPVIEVSENAFSRALIDDTQYSPEKTSDDLEKDPDQRTINVRMLDGENFVTDWGSLTSSLPPPPDHGLRSPIVAALLEQWTKDHLLHNSLMSWMDRVMSGEDPSSVPPLTLSSLDHQVRDGFVMHVLPLLLRRADILVDVKTRAHRTTTYDIGVSVKRLPRSNGYARNMPYMESTRGDEGNNEAASVSNSATHSAVTEYVRNGIKPDHYEVGSTAASYATGVSSSDGAQQQGIMSALGGAIGGLLSRRKQNSSNYYDAELPANSSYDMGSAAGAAGLGPMDFPPASAGLPPFSSDSEHGELVDDGYHRLVSAPPGRIGVTFVEFRGHAMVSDVQQDSPLLGWIFPSDILIAIDEVPVSGMRLRDIIKVLQGRNERQRALRVISSHAMNEFTMNATLST